MTPGSPNPEQGEIYWADLEPVRGNETAKLRPVVVLNAVHPRLDVRIVAPLLKAKPYHYQDTETFPVVYPARSNGLDVARVPDVFQVRAISTLRFGRRIGKLSQSQIAATTHALCLIIGAK